MRKIVLTLVAAAVLALGLTLTTAPVRTSGAEPAGAAPLGGQVLIGPYNLARGTITLDGTNPSSATTGLVSIVSCTVSHKTSTAPGDDPTYFTTITSAVAGRLDVYAWKNTGGTDPTLVASTDSAALVDYVCIGT